MSNKSLFIFHLHSDYSSCTTVSDSVTKVSEYVELAKQYGMTALAFSEHGNVYNWFEKKTMIENAGMKYVHAIEIYITENLEEKKRDNYHCVLVAKNTAGFHEINRLVSASFKRYETSDEGHLYYNPRISIEEFENISDNIIVTSACLASILNRGTDSIRKRYLDYFIKNKDRCYLEIQHHDVEEQKAYNRYLYELSIQYGLKLVTGTDTHSLDEFHAEGRVLLQKSKKTYFPEEDGWDLTFKNREQLTQSYIKQDCLPMEAVEQAMDNTLEIMNATSEIELDFSIKYPKLYDDEKSEFRKQCYEAIDRHPYALKYHTREELEQKLEEEIPVYEKTGTMSFMLFQTFVRSWEHEHNIWTGPGRGSVTGSEVAYLLRVTDIDSMRFNLNFFRFLNPDRVSVADVDSDYYSEDRDKVEKFLFDYDKLNCAKVVAFGTMGLRESILSAGRALDIPLRDVRSLVDCVQEDENKTPFIPDKIRAENKELFKLADLFNGVIVSAGTHAAGVVCATRDLESEIGLTTLSTTDYPVSSIDMYGLDALSYTKLDLLGLDNVGFINKTCELAGIERITPDNIPLDDWNVWKSISEDTSMIFQWDSAFASQYIRQLFSDSSIERIKRENPEMTYLKLMSLGNACIRPCGTSIRNDVAQGVVKKTGIKDIDDLLYAELGNCVIQEDIMLFLMKFCGFSLMEADVARKKIAKKKGTADLLPEVRHRFIENSKDKYGLSDQKVEDIIEPILTCILDATRYAFSWNHSDAYSFIGYACGYLRYYYPLEFCAACFNIWQDKPEKTAIVLDYATRHGIQLKEAKFRNSRSEYFIDRENSIIYKGMKSIKNISKKSADGLFELRNNKYSTFTDFLFELHKTKILRRDQLKILVLLDYFSEFGKSSELLKIIEIFDFFKSGERGSIRQAVLDGLSDSGEYPSFLADTIIKYSTNINDKGRELQTYTITDIYSLLYECEARIKAADYPELAPDVRISAQKDYLGYVYVSGKEADRTLLHVQDIYPIKRRSDGGLCGYSIIAKSVGSGKVTRYTVWLENYEKYGKINKDSLVRIKKFGKSHKNGSLYFSMDIYEVVME